MKVLFVCTGNTCRSPMAEAIFNYLSVQKSLPDISVSRGTNVFMPQKINPKSVNSLCKLGINDFNHTATQLTREDIEEADIVITMTSSQKMSLRSLVSNNKDKIITLLDKAYGKEADIADPFGGSQEVYDQCAKEIFEAIQKILCTKQ